MGINLYQIDQNKRTLFNMAFDQETGEITNDEIFEQYLSICDSYEQACLEWAAYYHELDAESIAIKSQIDRLQSILKSTQSKKNTIKEQLQRFITPGQKYKNEYASISWRKSESVEIVNQDLIPSNYIREKVEHNPDKTKIKEAIKSGQTIAGCELVSNNNIQIK